MTTYPLPTLACTVSPTGISAPAYNDILQSLIAIYTNIYGADVNLSVGTQDYQFLAALALAQNDTNSATIAAYNSYSPSTAQGIGLSSVVKINGLRRLVPTASTATVTVVGVAGTVILGGLVGDNQSLGTQWALPSSVTIPGGGTIDVTATCTVLGATAAGPNTLTQILNPTRGWQTANNAAAALLGQPVETDAALRTRQAVSTGQPAESPLGAIFAEVSNVPGVGRVLAYENATGSTDGNGVLAHSIAIVCDAGTKQLILNAIGSKKTPGTGMTGSQTGTYVDPEGVSQTVAFNYTAQQRITVTVTGSIKAGWNVATAAVIQASVAAFINSLPIGAGVRLFNTAAAAALYNAPLSSTYDLSAVTQAIFPASDTAADIAIAYNAAATCAASDVTVNIT